MKADPLDIFRNKEYTHFVPLEIREERSKAFFKNLAHEVEISRYDRILREKKGLDSSGQKIINTTPQPFGLSFASHRNDLRDKFRPKRVLKSKSAALAIVKHDDAGNAFTENLMLSDPDKGLKGIKKEVRKQGRKQLAIVQTDLNVCFYCEIKLDTLTLDHIIPKSRGGVDGAYNLIYCCERCNGAKGSMSLEKFRSAVLENKFRYGLGQIALMCANIAKLIHYRQTNPLMMKLRARTGSAPTLH